MKIPFCGITLRQAESQLREAGYDTKYALRVVTNFYRRGVYDFHSMDNIPKELRRFMDSVYCTGLSGPVKSESSSDGSGKHLFSGNPGKICETVILPDMKRNTVCVSTQSGCRMGCPFCLTGKSGFRGNLSAGEIINQVMSVPGFIDLDHVVFMGMGEPLDNVDEVLTACEIITSAWGLAISPRNVTVSTVGITPGVKKFLETSACNLTLSLFSPFTHERISVIPAEKKYPATEIVNLMKSFRLAGKRRLSIAYVMIKEVNDTDLHIKGLIELLKGTPIRVNLLPYHRIPGDKYLASPAARREFFRSKLLEAGISASIRKSRGEDISAACGLLASGLGR